MSGALKAEYWVMAPRYWTITIGTQTISVVAGTREAAENIAARRLAARREV